MNLIFTLEKNSERFSDLKHANKSLFQKLEQHSTVIKDENLLGPTAAFWFSFIEMLDILFTFTRTLRVGNWEGHLCATRKMLPWFFAYDKPNYSRFGTKYLADMLEAVPGIHAEFMQAFRFFLYVKVTS